MLDTLLYLKHETNTWFELTDLLIPGENDSDTEIREMTQWIVQQLGPEVPLHFTAFHPDWKMRDKPPTPKATLNRCRDIALDNGLQHVYTGNVHDLRGSSTYCHGCGEMLIGRDWYELSTWAVSIRNSRSVCAHCGTPLAGVFEGRPGNWGAQRKAIQVSDQYFHS